MHDINIPVSHDEETGIITIKAPREMMITQGDNNMQCLVFKRPVAFENSELVLLFYNKKVVFEEQNIGQSNQFIIPDVLTQETNLSLKIYYITDGERTLNSNNITFPIRESKFYHDCHHKGHPVGQLPNTMRQLTSKALIEPFIDGTELVFKNLAGVEVARIELPTDLSGVTQEYVDQKIDDEAAAREAADLALEEQINNTSPSGNIDGGEF